MAIEQLLGVFGEGRDEPLTCTLGVALPLQHVGVGVPKPRLGAGAAELLDDGILEDAEALRRLPEVVAGTGLHDDHLDALVHLELLGRGLLGKSQRVVRTSQGTLTVSHDGQVLRTTGHATKRPVLVERDGVLPRGIRGLRGGLTNDGQTGSTTTSGLGVPIGQLGVLIDQLAGCDEVRSHDRREILGEPAQFSADTEWQHLLVDTLGRRRLVFAGCQPRTDEVLLLVTTGTIILVTTSLVSAAVTGAVGTTLTATFISRAVGAVLPAGRIVTTALVSAAALTTGGVVTTALVSAAALAAAVTTALVSAAALAAAVTRSVGTRLTSTIVTGSVRPVFTTRGIIATALVSAAALATTIAGTVGTALATRGIVTTALVSATALAAAVTRSVGTVLTTPLITRTGVSVITTGSSRTGLSAVRAIVSVVSVLSHGSILPHRRRNEGVRRHQYARNVYPPGFILDAPRSAHVFGSCQVLSNGR